MPRTENTAAPATACNNGDAELVARLRTGDGVAFEVLVRTHGPQMLAVARRFLSKEADAEDAVQDAFVNVFRSIGSFAGDSRLSTWLYRVTVNAALMRIRARSRRPETPADDDAMEAARAATAQPGGEWTLTAADALAREEIRERIRGGLARLPEDVRAVVRLRDIQGMDLREIAALLDIGLTTVKSRLHRGRLALRAHLDPWMGASR